MSWASDGRLMVLRKTVEQKAHWFLVIFWVYVLFGQSGCQEDLSKQAAHAACQCAEQRTAYRLQKIDAYIKQDSTKLVRTYLHSLVDSLNQAIIRCYDSVRHSPQFSHFLADSAHYRAFNAATSPCGDRILPLVEGTLNRVRQALMQRNYIQYPQAKTHKTPDSIPLSLEPETGLESE